MFAPGIQLDWSLEPLEALARWPAETPVAMLHSGRHHPRWSRLTILAAPVATYRFEAEQPGAGRATLHLADPRHPSAAMLRELAAGLTHRPFADLRLLQRSAGDALWIGALAYDLGRWAEHMPPHRHRDRAAPLIELHYCPDYLLHDTATQTWSAHGPQRQRLPDLPHRTAQNEPFIADEPRAEQTREQYEASIVRALDYIAAGDIFQVNLAQRFTANYRGAFPLAQRTLFARLNGQSPAWYGAYLESCQEKTVSDTVSSATPSRAIASTSPELFLELEPDGVVWTRPIKGTRPASIDPAELRDSEKDAAELHMIVDLLRNDLGRVCDYGSVRVVEPRTIESHPTVHHGVATITGKLHASKDMADLLRACLPGGSITGAPKIRAMQIIDELEPVARGPYCGCLGYFSGNRACFNIAIRTLLIEQTAADAGRVDYSVGGGIVADSQPAAEYQETLDKAAALRAALRGSEGT